MQKVVQLISRTPSWTIGMPSSSLPPKQVRNWITEARHRLAMEEPPSADYQEPERDTDLEGLDQQIATFWKRKGIFSHQSSLKTAISIANCKKIRNCFFFCLTNGSYTRLVSKFMEEISKL